MREIKPESWLVPGAIVPEDLCPKCDNWAFTKVMKEYGTSDFSLACSLARADGFIEFTEHAGMYRPCIDCSPEKTAAAVSKPEKALA